MTEEITVYEENQTKFDSADEFTRAYIECALWLAEPQPDSGEYHIDDDDIVAIYPKDFDEMLKDCTDFQESEEEELKLAYAQPGYTPVRAGHDFYLNRNGHGAGFWDRGIPNGDTLSKAAKVYGESTLYCEQGDETDFDPDRPRRFYLSC